MYFKIYIDMTPKEKFFLWYISRQLSRWLSIGEWLSPAATLAIVFSSANDRGPSVAGGAGGIHLYLAFSSSQVPQLMRQCYLRLGCISPPLSNCSGTVQNCLLVILNSLELTEKINYHRCHSLGNTEKLDAEAIQLSARESWAEMKTGGNMICSSAFCSLWGPRQQRCDRKPAGKEVWGMESSGP